ncbi:serine hydrolase [Rossellomorea marisflavi]|uniref:serine hydrolase n=1 Tax=Rossellomorea marisflavi TaxID=189381 RepID=UPI00064F989C|nr:class A beta-lactamase [Rossellomorea marisflavi]KML02977.1 hypothetical protein VL06_15045 [Rossellomorea marisflavi]
MKEVIDLLKAVHGSTGFLSYSSKDRRITASYNEELVMPLASAGKVAIGFAVAGMVESGGMKWDEVIQPIRFNPDEDSRELYPHYQNRQSLMLGEAVEVMIACHDSVVAEQVVTLAGGWDHVNRMIRGRFDHMCVTSDPRSPENKGMLQELMQMLIEVVEGYDCRPDVWMPIMNGLVRQQEEVEGIPSHQLNHMTGGLPDMAIDIGVIGEFGKDRCLFVIGAAGVPDRRESQGTDDCLAESLRLLHRSLG